MQYRPTVKVVLRETWRNNGRDRSRENGDVINKTAAIVILFSVGGEKKHDDKGYMRKHAK